MSDAAYVRREMELRGKVEDARETAETYESVMRWTIGAGSTALTAFFGAIGVGVAGMLSTSQTCAVVFPLLALAVAALAFGAWWRDRHSCVRNTYGTITERLKTPRARLRAAQREYDQHAMDAGSS